MMHESVDPVNNQGLDPAVEVFETLHAVMHLFRSRRQAPLTSGTYLTHMEHRVLGFYARHPGASQTDLVMHLGRDKGQLARLVHGLRERGFLQSEVAATDRRSLRLNLTPAGVAAHHALQHEGRGLVVSAMSTLSTEEQHELLQYLKRIRARLEDGPL